MKPRLLAGCVVFVLLAGTSSSLAAPPANRFFDDTWQRTDLPVAQQQISRTWMWGPEAFTDALQEEYAGSPDNSRLVQYYDKSRMEITDPDADATSIWYVTNGLLVMELVTGRLQLGNNDFEQHDPANLNIAGDAGDTSGPTYAALHNVLDISLGLPEDPIIARIDREGNISDDPALAERNILAEHYVSETNHRVADPFWEFMNSEGLVYQDDAYVTNQLFQNPFFATGYPITEAYWATVQVGGEPKDVLLQCFERRCLTYTPDNPDGWQVESANVGRHYFEWRYEQLGFEPNSQPYPTMGDVRITFIQFQPGNVPDAEGEYVDITNFDDFPIDMTGWRLADAADFTYTFPDGFTLGLGATVQIHICDGNDTATDLYWGRCAATWNNTGDTGRLINAAGAVVNEYGY